MNKIWMSLIVLMLLSLACSLFSAIPGQPTQPAGGEQSTPSKPGVTSPSPFSAPATLTAGPTPKRSPTPTRVPIPTRTPVTPTEVLPTPPEGKAILIEYFDKYSGVAPELSSDAYYGRDLPRLVLYTDGQLIWRDDAGALWETIMTEDAVCTLLGGLQKFGLYKVEGDGTLGSDDPIYSKIPADALDTTGSTNFLLVVNGNPSKWVMIYRPFVDYTVRPVLSTWELFNSFKPSDLRPYDPELYVMWVEAEQKLARRYGAGEDLQPAEWPAGMTKLSKLLGDQPTVQLPLDPEEASPLLPFYEPAPGVKLFKEGKDLFSVILRPLLPHEELDLLSLVPREARRFALPFKCPK